MTRAARLGLSIAFAAVAALGAPASGRMAEPLVGSLQLLGEARIATGATFEETIVGGLSGITRDADRDVYYAVSDDPSSRSPARTRAASRARAMRVSART